MPRNPWPGQQVTKSTFCIVHFDFCILFRYFLLQKRQPPGAGIHTRYEQQCWLVGFFLIFSFCPFGLSTPLRMTRREIMNDTFLTTVRDRIIKRAAVGAFDYQLSRDWLFLFLGFLFGLFFLCCFFLAGATATSLAHFRILPIVFFNSKIRQQSESILHI